MIDPRPATVNSSKLYAALERHAQASGKKFHTKHPDATDFLARFGVTPGKIREHATKLLTSGVLAGSLFLAAPGMHQVQSEKLHQQIALLAPSDREKIFGQEVTFIVTPRVSPLALRQEQSISDLLAQYWGITAVPSYQGERLNTTYGLMGAEQHLPRYPGDAIDDHDEFAEKGMTSGKGAWGYFAPTKEQLTPDLVAKEKYYVAVQTLYLPDWDKRLSYLRDWYKYRKVVVVNPVNGKTIICDIADAGPAESTGKQFGGSPEVMAYLGLNTGMQKGPVVLFFVDDTSAPVPLGPLEYNRTIGKPLAQQ